MLMSMFRTVLLYALILFGLRLMGKRQISQLQTSELVATLLLSELAVLPIQHYDEPLLEGMAPMIILVIFEIIIAFLMMKSAFIRRIICGKPVVVIEKGKIDQYAMKRLRMTTEDLTEQLRQNNAFYLDEVEYAVIETNGMMSVIKHTEEDCLTPKQAGIRVEHKGIEVVVISDGVLFEASIKLCNKSKEWIFERIKEANLELKQVFMMTVNSTGNFNIIKREI